MTDGPGVVAPVCYRHPNRETYVRCTRCDRPICPDCMREASVGHQCPECVAQGRRTQRPARTAFGGTAAGRHGYVTKTLIAVNVVMLALSTLWAGSARALGGGGLGGLLGSDTPLHYWADLVPQPTIFVNNQQQVLAQVAGVSGGEWYRLFTSMFMHYGLIHLAMNMWALWIVGRVLESLLGPVRFLGLYLLSGLGGSIAVYLFAGQHSLTAGASGAIFGLFGALFVVLRRVGGNPGSILTVIIINLIFTFSIAGISWQGHLGGLVTGTLVGAGLAYAPRSARTAVQTGVVAAAVALLAVAAVVHTSMIA